MSASATQGGHNNDTGEWQHRDRQTNPQTDTQKERYRDTRDQTKCSGAEPLYNDTGTALVNIKTITLVLLLLFEQASKQSVCTRDVIHTVFLRTKYDQD